MKEFKIIVPAHDDHKLAEFEARLIRSHGGFTRTIGAGAWRNGESFIERETVWVYTVATDASSLTIQTLAFWALGLFEQDAIYLRHCDGEVEFVSS